MPLLLSDLFSAHRRLPWARRVAWLLSSLGGLALLLVAALTLPTRAAAAEDDFLDVEQAFRLSARVLDGRTLELRWDVAPGYYLYRERLHFDAQPESAQLGQPEMPAGKVKFDENLGQKVETYRDALVVRLPVTSSPDQWRLSVGSQGCADKGLCYPPVTHDFQISSASGQISALMPINAQASATPAPAAAPTGSTSGADGGSLDSRVASALRSGNLLSIVGLFIVAGLLLSLTPCVLPMVPILSSIIVGQGHSVSRGRGFSLALAYALGMALVYTAMGVAAGLLGEGLAAALQNPWVLGAFAALLVGLSLSMFGFYELQVPSALQSRLTEASSRLNGGRYASVFLMGGLSALIVGPCVAAPLAGALVYISQSRNALLGGVALFSLAMGMSAPLLLVGLSAGTLLPRAGGWMESVKHFFGVLLLAVAIWMVTPVIPAWLVMMLWATLLLVCAVNWHAFDRLPDGATGLTRLRKGLAIAMALVGASLLVGALSGGRDPLQPLGHLGRIAQASSAEGARPAAEHGTPFVPVRNLAELEAAVAASSQPVMLDFYADWCVSCKEMEKFTFSDPAVRARLAGMRLLQADVTANNADDKALLKRFGLFGPPGILFFTPGAGLEAKVRVIGYQDAAEFLISIKGV